MHRYRFRQRIKKTPGTKTKERTKRNKNLKKLNLAPLIDPTINLNSKIETITINYNKNNNINNDLNTNDFIKKEIIVKLDMADENNLLIIVNEFLDSSTKKIITDFNNNYNKVRLSFLDIIFII